jgi:RNA polymerase sigma-70 factor (ECF subfamily)
VQDTFIRAYRGLGRFRGDSSLATWLHRIAVNLARNRYWYFHRRRRQDTLSLNGDLLGPTGDSDATLSDLMASDEPTPVHQAVTVEFTELVTASMEKLDANQREILTLRNILNQSYDDIANALGIQVGTVKSRIARARNNLRALMVEACPEFAPDTPASAWFELGRPEGTLHKAAR